MFTTIEPRLIALLNSERPPPAYISPSLDLPPLHDPNILKSSGRPPPLEPDAVKLIGKLHHNVALEGSLPKLNDGSRTKDDDNSISEVQQSRRSVAGGGRALGISSPQSLRKILDVVEEDGPVVSKKRSHIETIKDDFVQLPQPVKKQKAAKQVVPPMIIGLFEPPPQAALFPPIASSSFHDSHGQYTLNMEPVQPEKLAEAILDKPADLADDKENSVVVEPKVSHATMKKVVQPRRKWTDEETNNLLLGVHKYGAGNWAEILGDKDFKFNKRSGSDLKDRFRTCCPAGWDGEKPQPSKLRKSKSIKKSSLIAENIMVNNENVDTQSAKVEAPAHRKSKAHRKEWEDLAQLGIDRPFQTSLRRKRRPFTDQEDQWILDGFEIHGFAWTKMVKDTRFAFIERTPTDLRDRFRNKFPEKFRDVMEQIKARDKKMKEHVEIKPTLVTSSSFESISTSRPTSSSRDQASLQATPTTSAPSSTKNATATTQSRDNLSIQQMLSEPQAPFKPSSQFNLKDILTFPETSTIDNESLPFTQSYDWTNPIIAPLDEMGISRLLLDEDTWPDLPGKERQTFTNINSILSGNEESGGFLNMLEEGREPWA